MSNIKLSTRVALLLPLLLVAALGIAVGIFLIWVDPGKFLWIAFIVLGIFTVISNLPSFISAIENVKQPHGVLHLVLASLSMALGLMMIFWQNWIVMVIVGAYLLIFPIIRIVQASDRVRQTREELPLLVLGIVLLLLGPGSFFDLLFRIGGWVIIGLSALYALFGTISVFRAK